MHACIGNIMHTLNALSMHIDGHRHCQDGMLQMYRCSIVLVLFYIAEIVLYHNFKFKIMRIILYVATCTVTAVASKKAYCFLLILPY